MPNGQPIKIVWYHKLQARFSFIFAMGLLLLGLAITWVMNTSGKEEVLKQSELLVRQHGQTVVEKLGQLVNYVEATTFAMSRTASLADSDVVFNMTFDLLDTETARSYVVGGGFWPSADMQSQKNLNPIHWRRDEKGQLILSVVPSDTLYTQEPWFAISRYLSQEQSYWTPIYQPLTGGQLVITCVMPFFHGGQFAGVVTTDISVDTLSDYLGDIDAVGGGYLMVLDPEQSFIFFPYKNEHARLSELRLSAKEFAEAEPSFRHFIQYIDEKEVAAPQLNREQQSWAKQLAQDSDNFDLSNAIHLVERISFTQKNTFNGNSTNPNDPIFKQPVMSAFFTIPRSHWQLVLVAPIHNLVESAEQITKELLVPTLSVALISFFVAYLFFQRSFLRPIETIINTIRKQKESKTDEPIDIKREDEFGVMVQQFNQHTASLNKAKTEAEKAARIKGNFLANMSHEIRTPMNGIIASAELLSGQSLDDESREYVEMIHRSGMALLTIINDILDYSKLEAGEFSLETIRFDLCQLVNDAHQLFSEPARQKGLKFDIVYPNHLPHWFMGDPSRIRQIMLNLLGNAIKFTEQGHVRLNIEGHLQDKATQSYHVELSVRDTGIGIAKDRLVRIFEEFGQADASITRRFGGTGLGLAICRRIAEAMDGDIDLESVVNSGSTFTFRWNMVVADSQVDDKVVQVKRSNPQYQGIVLVAEDNPVNQKLVKAYLTKLGFDVELAENGNEAVAQAQEKPFRLIFMDMQMPEKDGVTATKDIREAEGPNVRTPIIALTANAMPDDVQTCLNSGMNGYIAKPMTRDKLVSEINKFYQHEHY
jgi:signal transduction histidine kinase/CheY-like chemotaxis protein